MTIKEKVDIINYKIANATENFDNITLIAVSKTKTVAEILSAVEAGVHIIGENYVQELLEKYEQLNNMVEIHFIGHLQTNKVKYIIDKVSMIQSVHSLKLLSEIQKQALKIGKIQDVLIEINLDNEESKTGILLSDLKEIFQNVSSFENVCIKGFMAIAPAYYDNIMLQDYFKRMNNLFTQYKNTYDLKNVKMQFLSMGMSKDFELAIENGANMVRIGTDIFGTRNKE